MEDAVKEKIIWASPGMSPEAAQKLAEDMVKDGLQSVGQLSMLEPGHLTSRYNVPFFTALEMANKFKDIGKRDT